ncbi:MAG: SulP family inorganic anion transporter [Anaerolineae bacterium]|jgi:SulP family sulfate permease
MAQGPRRGFVQWLQDGFDYERLLPDLTSGVLIGITEIIFALSLASLIFSGELAVYLPHGIGMALVSAAVIMIGTSLASRVPGVIGTTQDSSTVILAVIAAALAGTLSAAGGHVELATVLVAIAFSALLTGLFFLALGTFKLGRLVRFTPYPVVGGFLAGTGWLLVQGSFDVMSGYPFTLANIPALLQPEQLILWVPGLLFALVLFVGMRRTHHFLTMPGILFGAIVLFYLALLATGTSLEAAIDSGLLLGKVAGEITWQPMALKSLSAADWAAILGQAGNISILLIVSVVGLLLNASSLELIIRQDVDLNHELRTAGMANLLSGLGGGMVGYHALSSSTLSYRIGARGRVSGILAGAICVALLFTGSALLVFFPVPILGGLLLFLGLDFLVDWVVEGWSRLTKPEYAVVLLILVVIAAAGFLVGVAVGLVAMIILFILSYSRINVVHHAGTGAEIRSSVERCTYHRQVLANELGPHIYILELQGFIFFGTANALLEQIRARVSDTDQPPVRYIVLDFRRVAGLDSSAVMSFVKGKQLAGAQSITLVLTHVSGRILEQLELGGLLKDEVVVRVFPDLDHGLEWCEEELLEVEGITAMHLPVTLRAQLADSGFEKANTARLMEFLERVDIGAGEYLIRQGQEADQLHFIERGTVVVCLETEGGEQVRLQTLGLGTAVGELGLYLGIRTTASAIAESPTVAYRLTRAALSRMKEEEPELAATFHEFIAHLLSERLTATTRTLEAVLR